jgi:integrase
VDTPRAFNVTQEIDPERIEELYALLGLDPCEAGRSLQAKSKSDLVFGAKEIWHWLKRAADKAGIKGLTVHHLRHTAASRMLDAGVDVKTVQEILGHSSLDITPRYLHTDATKKRNAIAKLSGIYLATSQKLANEVKSKTQTIEIKMFKNLPH